MTDNILISCKRVCQNFSELLMGDKSLFTVIVSKYFMFCSYFIWYLSWKNDESIKSTQYCMGYLDNWFILGILWSFFSLILLISIQFLLYPQLVNYRKGVAYVVFSTLGDFSYILNNIACLYLFGEYYYKECAKNEWSSQNTVAGCISGVIIVNFLEIITITTFLTTGGVSNRDNIEIDKKNIYHNYDSVELIIDPSDYNTEIKDTLKHR